MRVVLFNGPPGSGKDTAANFALKFLKQHDIEWDDVCQMKFSSCLKRAAHELLGLSGKSADYYEASKDQQMDEFFGMSPRDVYIALSENFAKRFFTSTFFGDVMVRELESIHAFGEHCCVIFSDSGFINELIPLVTASVKNDKFLILQMQREGCTFDNDSRSYINYDHPQVEVMLLDNNGTLEQLDESVRLVIDSWIIQTRNN